MGVTIALFISICCLLAAIVLVLHLIKMHIVSTPIVTKHGIWFKRTPKTWYFTQKLVEKWTDELVSFWWFRKKDWDQDDILKAIEGAVVTLYDQQMVVYPATYEDGSPGRGYARALVYQDSKVVSIATLTDTKPTIRGAVKQHLRHELSHLIFWRLDADKDTKAHHLAFRRAQVEE